MLRLIWRPTNVPAALALLVIVVAGLFAEYQNRRLNEERLRADVLAQVSLIRAKLEGNINSNIQLVRGLVATLSTEPAMSQARFAELAGNLLAETVADQEHRRRAGPRRLAGLIRSRATSGDRADYRENEAQREAALRARDTGELVLAGPVDLVQGGRGFIGRFPVFVDDGRTATSISGASSRRSSTWNGSIATAACSTPNLPIDIAISGRDGTGSDGGRFFGDGTVVAERSGDGRRHAALRLLADRGRAQRRLGPDAAQCLAAAAADPDRPAR